jgi:hypothetical protein
MKGGGVIMLAALQALENQAGNLYRCQNRPSSMLQFGLMLLWALKTEIVILPPQ